MHDAVLVHGDLSDSELLNEVSRLAATERQATATLVAAEGTLIHPNYDEADRLFQVTGKHLQIYVSGGISEAKHLKILNKIGVAGAIIGKAFHEKLLTVAEAEEAAG